MSDLLIITAILKKKSTITPNTIKLRKITKFRNEPGYFFAKNIYKIFKKHLTNSLKYAVALLTAVNKATLVNRGEPTSRQGECIWNIRLNT